MAILFEHQETTYIFQRTAGGLLDLAEQIEGRAADAAQATPLFVFAYDELGTSNRLLLTAEEPHPPSAAQLAALARVARITAYARAGVLCKAAQWINYQLGKDGMVLAWLKAMLRPEERRALFFDFALGSFGDQPPAAASNTALLLDEPVLHMEQEFLQWLAASATLSTRVVGFRFRQKRFEETQHGDTRLRLASGDGVLPLREPDNAHDPFAVALHWHNGEKLGYVKRELARHLAPLLDSGMAWTGRVGAVLADWRDPNERVFVQLRRLERPTA